MRKDEDFSDEFTVYFWLRIVIRFVEDYHTFPHIFPSHIAQGKRSRLTSGATRSLNSFAFNRANFRRCKLTNRVRSDQNGVSRMDNSTFNDSGNHRPHEGNRECVVYVELERCIRIVTPVVRKDVKERADKIKIVACNIRNLEYRAYSTRDKLGLRAMMLVQSVKKGYRK